MPSLSTFLKASVRVNDSPAMSVSAATRIIVEARPRIAVGIDCMWWGPIADAHVSKTQLVVDEADGATTVIDRDRFRCPRCGGAVSTMHTEESFLALARRFEILGFPHHRRLIGWLKGKCYKTRAEAWGAFCAEGLIV